MAQNWGGYRFNSLLGVLGSERITVLFCFINYMESKKAVIYYRVSTEDQAQFGVSLEQQKKNCVSYAEANHIEVVKMFHDDGESAKTVDRPGLQEMLKFCAQKGRGIDCLMVYKVDRLSRNVNDYSNILVFLSKLGIKLISTTEAIDETPTGKFIGNIMAASAQFDNDIKSQRVTACMREKLEQGIWCWKAPFGYLNGRDETNRKTIVLDEKRAPIIRWAFEQYATGSYTLEEIRREINKKGLRAWKGGEVSSQLMNRIITCKFFIGVMTSKGEDLDNGTHERLISEELFYKCQAVLRRNNKADNISRSRPSEAFALKHFVICAYCGRPLTAYFSTGKCGGEYPYYRCYNKDCASKKSIAKKKIENDFVDYLKDIVPTDKFAKSFKAVILDVWQDEYKRINSDRERQLKRTESLKNEKAKLIEMKKKELLPDDDFKEAFDKLRSELNEMEANLSEVRVSEFNIDEAVDYVFDFFKALPRHWEEATCEQRIKLQSLIFAEKPVYDYIKFQTPKLSPILQIKKDLALANSSFVAPTGIEPVLPH